MTPYRRRARFDSDRFDNVRARERFLYEFDDDWQDADHHHDNTVREYALIAFLAVLLTGTIILSALYLGKRTLISPTLAQTSEPAISAAMPIDRSTNASSQCRSGEFCEADLNTARIAWQYFDNNHHTDTGLVNSVDNIETTTLWDTGSSIAAFIAARDFGFITQHQFDHSVMQLLQTMSKIDLVEGVAPNILYNTRTAQMVDYSNSPSDNGIGVSTIDLARSAFWLNTLRCMHPKYHNPVARVLARWDYSKMIQDGELYGLARTREGNIINIQQGRFGFEQYAGRIFQSLGHSVEQASSYQNKHRTSTEILGLMIAHDTRDPRETGVNNFVLTDSYTLDAMELGLNSVSYPLLENIFKVQKKRWRETGIATALSDGHINQPPHFLYNTIFDAGLSFTTTTDTGVRHADLRTVSTKAAFTLAALFPQDLYSNVLLTSVESAYDPTRGWFSGVYENGGFNDISTANTNGIILQTMLFKKYGALGQQCRSHWISGNSAVPLPVAISEH